MDKTLAERLEVMVRRREAVRDGLGIPVHDYVGQSDIDDLREAARAVREAVPDAAAVDRVAWHIGKAVEYIEKQWPDAKMLDREPILRNMRRWHEQLTAAPTQDQENGS